MLLFLVSSAADGKFQAFISGLKKRYSILKSDLATFMFSQHL